MSAARRAIAGVATEVACGCAALLLQPEQQFGQIEVVVVREEFHQPRDRHGVADVRERVALAQRGLEVKFGEVGHLVRARQALRLRGCARPCLISPPLCSAGESAACIGGLTLHCGQTR